MDWLCHVRYWVPHRFRSCGRLPSWTFIPRTATRSVATFDGAAFSGELLLGWVAHRLCYRMLLPVEWLTIAFALLADFAVLGGLFLVIWPAWKLGLLIC